MNAHAFYCQYKIFNLGFLSVARNIIFNRNCVDVPIICNYLSISIKVDHNQLQLVHDGIILADRLAELFSFKTSTFISERDLLIWVGIKVKS